MFRHDEELMSWMLLCDEDSVTCDAPYTFEEVADLALLLAMIAFPGPFTNV